jgi:hypothetical protein
MGIGLAKALAEMCENADSHIVGKLGEDAMNLVEEKEAGRRHWQEQEQNGD